jgi:site-specific DNA recombinase
MNNSIKTNKAVIYCRVSSHEQVEEGNSLATQKRLCLEYASKNGYEVFEENIYIEKGESAKTINRTELNKMLRYCSEKKNKVNAVIFYKIDRLSRNTDDYSQLRLLFKKYEVNLISITEKFEDNAVGRFIENTMANVSQLDNDIRTERIVGGQKQAVLEGRYVWSAPLGYTNGKVEGKSNLVQNENAKYVRQIFELIDKGIHSLEDIRMIINQSGMKTKSGGPVGKSHYYEMIRNCVYAGIIRKFKEEREGTYEPIVSKELFFRVQKNINRNGIKSRVYKMDSDTFPLRRFVHNPERTKKLTGSPNKSRNGNIYFSYNFSGKGKCYNSEKLNNMFEEFLAKQSLPSYLLLKLKSRLKEKFDNATIRDRKELRDLNNKLKVLETRQTNLLNKNLEGKISDELFDKQNKLLEEELFKVQGCIANCSTSKYSFEGLLDFTNTFLQSPNKIWSQSKIDKKVQIQWFVFPEGLTFDGEKLRTTKTSLLYRLKEANLVSDSGSVEMGGIEPPCKR